MMAWKRGQLWQNADFLKLWAGETVSLFGTAITDLALPLTAVLVLQASASQVAFLSTASYLPYLLFPLFVGLWVDQTRRKPLMIGAHFGRALLVSTIPLLPLVGYLKIELLFGITFLVGALTVIFNLAYRAYFPGLVSREHLLEGNSKLEVSNSMAAIGGPGLAGWLIGLLSAPFTLLLDAFSYLVAGFAQLAIHRAEPQPPKLAKTQSLRSKLSEGFRVIFGNPSLRNIMFEAGTYNACSQVITPLFLVYAARDLGFEAWLLGLIFSIGSLGALVGSLGADALSRKIGLGKGIVVSMVIACVPMLAVAFVGGDKLAAAVILGVTFLLNGTGLGLSNIYCASYRQAVIPNRVLGRCLASYSLVGMGALSVGSLVAGVLEPLLGLRLLLLIGAILIALAPLWVIFSPVPRINKLPELKETPPVPVA